MRATVHIYRMHNSTRTLKEGGGGTAPFARALNCSYEKIRMTCETYTAFEI